MHISVYFERVASEVPLKKVKLEDSLLTRIMGYEKNFTNYVLDPLYGQVGLTNMEEKIIQTETFKRLKRIQQLGLASQIYPSATHTRFEHSIGTLHVTWSMFKRFAKNYVKYKTWAEVKILSFFSDEIIEGMRLAALLHDVGHGPLSHAFENVAKSLSIDFDHDQLTIYLLVPKLSSKEFNGSSSLIGKILSKNESLRQRIFNVRKELQVIPEEIRHLIVSILDPTYEPISNVPEGFEVVRYFIHDLIKGDFGADRIDYLLRDTYFAGLGHRFNLFDLLDNIRGIYNPISKRLLFAIDIKGRDAAEFLLTTRYYHYRLIAHHPENITRQVLLYKQLEKKLKEQTLEKERLIARFLEFALTDDYTILRELPKEENLSLVGVWELREIGIPYYRYLFYRVLEDPLLCGAYLKVIKENLCKEIKSLDEEEIHIEPVVEKPNIPIVETYMENYLLEKDKYENKMSPLLHDHSTLIFGLARTYLSNTSILLYVNKSKIENVKKYCAKTHSFFLSKEIFKKIMGQLTKEKMKGHDLLLLCLFKLTNRGQDEFKGFGRLSNEISEMQKRLEVDIYCDLDRKAYGPGEDYEFSYSPSMFNDLILFDVSRIIQVRPVMENVRRQGRKPRYAIQYCFTPLTYVEAKNGEPRFPIKEVLDFYPDNIKAIV